MACASCAQRRALINQAFKREISVSSAASKVAQTVRNDFAKIRQGVIARKGQPVKFR